MTKTKPSPPYDALELSILAGEIMLKNGAETYRVEDTMKRILQNYGYESAEAFVTTTGLFVSVTDDSLGAVTMLRRINDRGINYNKVSLVNDLSRKIAGGGASIADARVELDSISRSPLNSPFIRIFASGIASMSFTFIFKSAPMDCVNAFFTGLMLQILVIPLRKSGISNVLVTICGGALISFLSLTLMNLGIGVNIDKIMIGSLMPMVPGVAITNAIRDILEGDYLSGASQMIEAVIIAISLAAGVGIVFKLWLYLFGGVII